LSGQTGKDDLLHRKKLTCTDFIKPKFY